jgi:hypothetical protein
MVSIHMITDAEYTVYGFKHSRKFVLIYERSFHIRAFCTQYLNRAHAERNTVGVESDKKSYFVVDKNEEHKESVELYSY